MTRDASGIGRRGVYTTRWLPLALITAATVLLVLRAGDAQDPVIIGTALVVAFSVLRLTGISLSSSEREADARHRHHDVLTGLPTRHALLDEATLSDSIGAIVVIDINDFREVNGSYGVATGDRLLAAVASRLAAHVRQPDLLVRLGGDRFAAALLTADGTIAMRVAERLIQAVEEPFLLDGANIRLTASAGSGVFQDVPDVETLLQHAEAALDLAKEDGPGVARTFDGRRGDVSLVRLERRAELRAEFETGGAAFALHYQPVVDMTTGEVTSLEALIRWDRQGALLYPGEFLMELRRGNLLAPLTRLVLQRSLLELRQHGIALPVAVNVPPEVMTPWLIDEIATACAMSGARPTDLIIEITEDAVVRDPEGVRAVLDSVRAGGSRVMLDDFGTGWSGLSMLRDLSLDGIKIDRSFSGRVAYDPTVLGIMQAIATLCASLGLDATAEGAEDRATLDVLGTLGFRSVQGYVITRPMPVDALEHWLATRVAAPIITL